MKVLVLGDEIRDIYRHTTATRLCPEAPAPVVVETQEKYYTLGGAGLVAQQLVELFGNEKDVFFSPSSMSEKERIFADGRLLVRIDRDTLWACASRIYLDSLRPEAVIVSDYGKGAFTEEIARQLISEADKLKISVFVDAKKNWRWYTGCFAIFPNKTEAQEIVKHQMIANHCIHKLGPEGCAVDGVHIPTNPHPVRDVTGAGDVFIAAFVYSWLSGKKILPNLEEKNGLEHAARFANKVAGISVEYVGTHVVSKEELDNLEKV